MRLCEIETNYVANALRINGAMIAAAHRAEDRSLTEHGKLTLQVGEFFVQHIYDYDEGYTIGTAISSDAFMPTIGGHSGSGYTFATVGQGDVKCTKAGGTCQLDSANRDVTKPKEWEMDYDVKPITAYVPLGDMPELPKTDEGGVDWSKVGENVKGQAFAVIKELGEAVGIKPDKQIQVEQDVKETLKQVKEKQQTLKDKYEQLDEDERQEFDDHAAQQEEALKNIAENFAAPEKEKSTTVKALEAIAEGIRKLAANAMDETPMDQLQRDLMELNLMRLKMQLYGQMGARVGGVGGTILGIGLAVGGEIAGRVFKDEIAKAIETGKEKVAGFLKEKFPGLNEQDVKTLAAGALLIAGAAALTAIQVKDYLKDLKALRVATTAGSKVKVGMDIFEDRADDTLRKSSMDAVHSSSTGTSAKHFDVKSFKIGTLDDTEFKKAIDQRVVQYKPYAKHHQHATGDVAPPPTRPEEMLKQSFKFKETSDARVAVDSVHDEIVIFHGSYEGKDFVYHGYNCPWKDVPVEAQNILKDVKFVDNRGNMKRLK